VFPVTDNTVFGDAREPGNGRRHFAGCNQTVDLLKDGDVANANGARSASRAHVYGAPFNRASSVIGIRQ
jgi:hypothetical protein